MPRYLNLFAYTPETLASLCDDPQDRSAVVREWTEARGGKLLAFYHMGGGVEYHGFSISEEPDVGTAGAAGWAVEAAGHFKKFRGLRGRESHVKGQDHYRWLWERRGSYASRCRPGSRC
jgi:uncharacterized protein with GYD domain